MFLLSVSLMDQNTLGGILFGGFMQTLMLILFLILIAVLFILFCLFLSAGELKRDKARDKAYKLKEKGLYEKAYLELSKYMNSDERDENDYYLAGVFCDECEKAGWNPPDSTASSLYWFEKGADAGHSLSKFEFAKRNLKNNFPNNIEACIKPYRVLKNLGDSGLEEAQKYFKSCTDFINQKVEENVISKVEAAAIFDKTDLLMEYGNDFLKKGLGKKALESFSYAAGLSHTGAAYFCGLIYENGFSDVEKDYKLAAEWYKKAARNETAKHCLHIGEFFLNINDLESAAECFAAGCDNRDEDDEIRGACAYFANWIYGELFLQVGKKYNGDMKKCEKDPDFIEYGKKALEYKEKQKKFGYVPSEENKAEE